MNKLVAAVGLAALAAGSAQAQVPGQTADMPKQWSASATLRGFYDDNLNTSTDKQEVFGFEVTPALGYQFATPQTHISLGYVYSFKYYDHRPIDQSEKYDQSHAFSLALEHAFSERHQLIVGDSFVIGQEPDFLRAGNSMATFERISGNNIRNYGSIAFKEQFTRLFGIEVGYNNAFYDYADDASSTSGGGDPANPSSSATLDRLEHTIHLDTRWVLQPETVGVLGYQFRITDYTANEVIGAVNGGDLVTSDLRNYRQHYFYIGADHSFCPNLNGSVRAGARYIDYYNDPTGAGNGWGPYVNLNLMWTYALDSYAQVGLTQDISSTDQTGGINQAATVTASQETTVVYGSINHRITPRLKGSLVGQFQYGNFNGGDFNNKSEQDYLLGLNLNYQLTQHFSTELGYSYDRLDSDIGRSFDRNRVYIGVTAGY